MSALLMGRAFYVDLPAHLKFTLVALCDEASDEGIGVFIGQRRLGQKIGATDRTARSNLAELRDRGFITRLPTAHPTYRTDQHEIVVDKLPHTRPETSSAAEAHDSIDRKPSVVSSGNGVPTTHELPVSSTHEIELASRPRRDRTAITETSRRDLIFETLFELETGLPYSSENRSTMTRSALSALQKPAAEIRATRISLEDLRAAIASWPRVMNDATCTAFAVAKHLPRLRAASRGMVARRDGERDRMLAAAERGISRAGRP